MKFDLTDTTFLVPLRVDSMVRLENTMMCVRCLLQNFNTNITVLQADCYDNGIVAKLLGKNIKYWFVEDYDPVFYRTKYLNMMTNEAATPYIGIWDADVIVPHEQIMDAVGKLREGYEIAYPYDGHFYDTTDMVRQLYWETENISVLKKNDNKMQLTYGTGSVGGAILVNRNKYMEAGMEDEAFYGWGPEDGERMVRWRMFGYQIYRTEGNLYHLSHRRGMNSKHRSMDHYWDSNNKFHLITLSAKEDLKKNEFNL